MKICSADYLTYKMKFLFACGYNVIVGKKVNCMNVSSGFVWVVLWRTLATPRNEPGPQR